MEIVEKLSIIANLIGRETSYINPRNIPETIDCAARLRDHIKELQLVEKALTAQLTGDVVLDTATDQGKSATIKGINFYASVIETIRWTLDSKAVKAEMGQAWYDERCKTSTVRSVKYHEGN